MAGHSEVKFLHLLIILLLIASGSIILASRAFLTKCTNCFFEPYHTRFILSAYLAIAIICMGLFWLKISNYKTEQLDASRLFIRSPRTITFYINTLAYFIAKYNHFISVIVFGIGILLILSLRVYRVLECSPYMDDYFVSQIPSKYFDAKLENISIVVMNLLEFVFVAIEIPFLCCISKRVKMIELHYFHHTLVIITGANAAIWMYVFLEENAILLVYHFNNQFPPANLHNACAMFATNTDEFDKKVRDFTCPLSMEFALAAIEVLLRVWVLPHVAEHSDDDSGLESSGNDDDDDDDADDDVHVTQHVSIGVLAGLSAPVRLQLNGYPHQYDTTTASSSQRHQFGRRRHHSGPSRTSEDLPDSNLETRLSRRTLKNGGRDHTARPSDPPVTDGGISSSSVTLGEQSQEGDFSGAFNDMPQPNPTSSPPGEDHLIKDCDKTETAADLHVTANVVIEEEIHISSDEESGGDNTSELDGGKIPDTIVPDMANNMTGARGDAENIAINSTAEQKHDNNTVIKCCCNWALRPLRKMLAWKPFVNLRRAPTDGNSARCRIETQEESDSDTARLLPDYISAEQSPVISTKSQSLLKNCRHLAMGSSEDGVSCSCTSSSTNKYYKTLKCLFNVYTAIVVGVINIAGSAVFVINANPKYMEDYPEELEKYIHVPIMVEMSLVHILGAYVAIHSLIIITSSTEKRQNVPTLTSGDVIRVLALVFRGVWTIFEVIIFSAKLSASNHSGHNDQTNMNTFETILSLHGGSNISNITTEIPPKSTDERDIFSVMILFKCTCLLPHFVAQGLIIYQGQRWHANADNRSYLCLQNYLSFLSMLSLLMWLKESFLGHMYLQAISPQFEDIHAWETMSELCHPPYVYFLFISVMLLLKVKNLYREDDLKIIMEHPDLETSMQDV